MGFMDFVHGALDVAGFIPGVGAIADGINAGIYAAEGDWGNAALSLAAAVPGVGDAAAVVGKTAKIAGKAAKAAKTTKAAKTVKVAKAAKSSNALSKLKGMCSWIKNIAGKAKTGAKKIADKLGKITDFVKQKLRNKKKSKKAGSCFTGDMTVCVENGYCFITEIQNGDDIYTRNAETGEEGIRKVYNAVQSEAHTIYHIQLDGKEEIKTTAYHPFFVKEKGWVNAINLKDGDLLETMAGEALVTKIFKIRHEEPVKVYNFQVEEWESYFVSGMQVYVHNGNPCAASRTPPPNGTRSTTISNDVLDHPRKGSALKVDEVKPTYEKDPITGKMKMVQEFPATAQAHGFNDLVDNYAGYATKTPLKNATLYQLEGSLNGVPGRFEWIIQDGYVTHRMFIQNGTMNGVPIKP